MDEGTKNAKINQFLNDKLMAKAVYEVILDSYLFSQRQSDVNFLAASRIAIDLLQEAWKDLSKHKIKEKEDKVSGNVGL